MPAGKIHFLMMTYHSIKKRIFEIVDRSKPGDTVSRIFDISIISLIIFTIFTIFIETFPIPYRLQKFFDNFEIFTLIVFSVEYLLRLWVSPYLYPRLSPAKARVKYFFSFMALMDLMAILPFYVPALYPFDLRILRVFWLIKANRHTSSMRKLFAIMKRKKSELFYSLFVLIVLMMATSVLVYHFESAAQPDVYGNALEGLWWSISIFTFAWPGDVYPITIPGRLLGGVMAIIGMAIIAVPVGIISSGFMESAEKKHKNKEKDVKLELLNQIKEELEDIRNTINEKEKK